MGGNNRLKSDEMAANVTVTNLRTSKGVQFEANQSLPQTSWRLVHNEVQVLDFFESGGFTTTINPIFVGTEIECETEITKLGLEPQDVSYASNIFEGA